MQPAQPRPPDPPTRRRSRRPHLACLGDLTVDIVISRRQALAAGSDASGTIGFRAGGSAANTARAFAALGGRSVFVGAVGDDGWGRRLVAALRAEGVAVHATRVGRSTARLAVLLGAGGERSFITDRGAADDLRPGHLRGAWFARADCLHLPAYSLLNEPLGSAARSAIGHVRRAGGLVSIDLSSRTPLLAGGRAAARRLAAEATADLLLANADEARALAGSDATRLLELAPLVVIKEGAAGCRVLWRGGTSAGGPDADAGTGEIHQLVVATRRLATTDTTGAGDAFDAGFLHALIGQGLPRSAATLRRAAVAGHRSAAQWLRRPRAQLEM